MLVEGDAGFLQDLLKLAVSSPGDTEFMVDGEEVPRQVLPISINPRAAKLTALQLGRNIKALDTLH